MKPAQEKKDDWNANLYDKQHSFVSKYGESLIELLAPEQGEYILDLGCGTGDLANQLHQQYGTKILGIDNSERMVAQAREKYPTLSFRVQDATKLNFDSEFDAVFSNATLHWVKPPTKALQCIYKSLKKGGRFIAEFGGKGNVQIITNEIIQQIIAAGLECNEEDFPWFYPSIGEYSSLMEKTGFRVIYAQHFDRPTPLDGENGLKNWIQMFGNQLFIHVSDGAKDEIISNVEYKLKKELYRDGHWTADYKRIRVIGLKE